jgi:hypothetical protein
MKIKSNSKEINTNAEVFKREIKGTITKAKDKRDK